MSSGLLKDWWSISVFFQLMEGHKRLSWLFFGNLPAMFFTKFFLLVRDRKVLQCSLTFLNFCNQNFKFVLNTYKILNFQSDGLGLFSAVSLRGICWISGISLLDFVPIFFATMF